MPSSPDPKSDSSLDSAEANMRRALGLDDHGGPSRPRSEAHRPRPDASAFERSDRAPDRPVTSDRHTSDRHRTRFVQDGDVPVTVVNRRPHDGPAPSGRSGVSDPALASERAGRERAERALAEALAVIRDLRTKQAHADLTWQEAAASATRAAAVAEAMRVEAQTQAARLRDDLAAEQAAYARAERERDAAHAELRTLQAATKRVNAVATRRSTAQRAVPRAWIDSVSGDDAPETALDPAPVEQGVFGADQDATVQQTMIPAEKLKRVRKTTRASEPQPVKWWIR